MSIQEGSFCYVSMGDAGLFGRQNHCQLSVALNEVEVTFAPRLKSTINHRERESVSKRERELELDVTKVAAFVILYTLLNRFSKPTQWSKPHPPLSGILVC